VAVSRESEVDLARRCVTVFTYGDTHCNSNHIEGLTVPSDPFQSIGQTFMSGFAEQFRKSAEAPIQAGAKPRKAKKNKAAKQRAALPHHAPPARPQGPPVPTASTPEMLMLEGMFEGKYLGHYSLSFAMGQLMVDVYQASPPIGGMYAVDGLPFGEWFVLADKRGFLLPLAIQRVRMDAFCVRADPAPLQGLRALPAAYGAAPPPVRPVANPAIPPARWAAQPQRSPQQAQANRPGGHPCAPVRDTSEQRRDDEHRSPPALMSHHLPCHNALTRERRRAV
jgi:hypothetical protein